MHLRKRRFFYAMSSPCQVCLKEPHKYRCPGCNLQTCSLQCSKQHKEQCGEQRKKEMGATANHGIPRALGTEEHSHRQTGKNSLDFIISAPEIQKLFIEYPQLRTQMRSIYEAFLQHRQPEQLPADHFENSTSGGHVRGDHKHHGHVHNRHSASERDTENAVKRLQWHIDTSRTDSAGLREFCKTVIKLRARDPLLYTDEQNNRV